MEIKVFSYWHKAYQFRVVCITCDGLNSYWVRTAGIAQADLRLCCHWEWVTPSSPLVICSCHFTCASSAHIVQPWGSETDLLIWQKPPFCKVCFQPGIGAFQLPMIRQQWEYVAESGNKVPAFGSSMVSGRLLQPVECSPSACAVEDILRLFGQLIKLPPPLP